MLKRTISLSLLCMASHAYSANIVVTTTADEDNTNPNACSLREAIALINGDPDNTDPDKRDLLNSNAGYGGCGGKAEGEEITYSPVIELKAQEIYTLTKGQVLIRKAMTIRSDGINSINDPSGANNPTIRTEGKHRLFDINDGSTTVTDVTTVRFDQVNLQGCAHQDADQICDVNGGVIANREHLILNGLLVRGGHAEELGGAIFNSSVESKLTLTNVAMTKNRSANGAALSFNRPLFTISSSYFAENTATQAQGSVLHVEEGIDSKNEAGEPIISTGRTGRIQDSIFYQNTARVTRLVEGMLINNSTIVDNRAGIFFNASGGLANVANSIVAGNETFDCDFATGDQSYLNNNLYMTGCEDKAVSFSTAQIRISGLGEQTLFAAQVEINGQQRCARPPAFGLLCRPQMSEDLFNPFIRPRLLSSYNKLSDSLIVNKGRNSGTTTEAFHCTNNDQRGLRREICDIGAVELVIENNRQTNGQDLRFGDIATLDLTEILGDGELMPAESCVTIYPNISPEGGQWRDGCLVFTRAPQKGTAELNADGQMIYRPLSDFHGVDRFFYDVLTTTSRFSDGRNDQAMNIETTIVQEPNAGKQNKTVKVAGGSLGLISLLGLLGVAVFGRRYSQKKGAF
ncbi:MAG: rhombotarget A [Pseudomonadota bacterium]|nr:rhombotarget A [Pseudomonadota bacterium]